MNSQGRTMGLFQLNPALNGYDNPSRHEGVNNPSPCSTSRPLPTEAGQAHHRLWWLIAALAFVAIFLIGVGITSGIVSRGGVTYDLAREGR